jgi:hypothetical protein
MYLSPSNIRGSSPAEQVHGARQHRVRGLKAAGNGRQAHQAQPLPVRPEALLVLHFLVQPARRSGQVVMR